MQHISATDGQQINRWLNNSEACKISKTFSSQEYICLNMILLI